MIRPGKGDIGRRVIHRTGRKGVLLSSHGPAMCTVRFDDGRTQPTLRANLYWDSWFVDLPDPRPDSDDASAFVTIGEAAATVVEGLAQAFTDADTNQPDSFAGDGGSFGGGGSTGDW